jgi:hypothetical protein
LKTSLDNSDVNSIQLDITCNNQSIEEDSPLLTDNQPRTSASLNRRIDKRCVSNDLEGDDDDDFLQAIRESKRMYANECSDEVDVQIIENVVLTEFKLSDEAILQLKSQFSSRQEFFCETRRENCLLDTLSILNNDTIMIQ